MGGNEPRNHILYRKKPSALNLADMVVALNTQWTTEGWGGRMSMGDNLDLFFMTQRVRKRPHGWKRGYSFKLSVRICFLNRAIHPKRGWRGGSQEGMSSILREIQAD